MKSKSLILLFALSTISFAGFSQTKTDTIKVYGNCNSCKAHIENAAKAAGAFDANWNKTTKMLVVSYDASKTTNMKIQEKIANVGYDTQDKTAPIAAYKKLDECCQYDRPNATTNKTTKDCCKDNNSCSKDGCCKADMSCCKKTDDGKDCCSNGKCNGNM